MGGIGGDEQVGKSLGKLGKIGGFDELELAHGIQASPRQDVREVDDVRRRPFGRGKPPLMDVMWGCDDHQVPLASEGCPRGSATDGQLGGHGLAGGHGTDLHMMINADDHHEASVAAEGEVAGLTMGGIIHQGGHGRRIDGHEVGASEVIEGQHALGGGFPCGHAHGGRHREDGDPVARFGVPMEGAPPEDFRGDNGRS